MQTSANFDHYLNLIPNHREDAIELIEMLKNGQTLEEIAESITDTVNTDHGYELDQDETVADLRIHIEAQLSKMNGECLILEDLLAVIRAYQAYSDSTDADMEGLIDITSLPTFGGSEPTDTLGVFSWDDARVLIYDNAWTIQDREPELVEHDDKRARLAGWFGGASWGWSGDDQQEFKAAIWDEMEDQGVRDAPWFQSREATIDAINISNAWTSEPAA